MYQNSIQNCWNFIGIFIVFAIVITPLVYAQNDYDDEREHMDPVPSRPRFDRVNRWMKVIQDFFTDGNWLNGGPDNLLEYITRTLGKLLNILLNRSSSPPPSDQLASQKQNTDLQQIKTTLTDILKMIPADRLNINDLNLN